MRPSIKSLESTKAALGGTEKKCYLKQVLTLGLRGLMVKFLLSEIGSRESSIENKKK